MEIAGAGPTGLRELHVTRSDEIGWMGTAFNEMVLSLRQAYDSQEVLANLSNTLMSINTIDDIQKKYIKILIEQIN